MPGSYSLPSDCVEDQCLRRRLAHVAVASVDLCLLAFLSWWQKRRWGGMSRAIRQTDRWQKSRLRLVVNCLCVKEIHTVHAKPSCFSTWFLFFLLTPPQWGKQGEETLVPHKNEEDMNCRITSLTGTTGYLYRETSTCIFVLYNEVPDPSTGSVHREM